ncbi:MAG TPA: 50S ribosomal protein L30 [Crenotrichaceae bacterium]|nr:50S ribosomal protein L30 [Crenotrichaceae bacterium]
MASKQLRVTQIKSTNGRLLKHKQCLHGLGKFKLNKTIVVNDTPENRGMINKISYLLKVEEI